MEDIFQRIESSRTALLQGSHWAALINAYGCVLKNLDKALSIFDSIASHPSARRGNPLPDAVTYESLINVLVTHKRMDLAQDYVAKLQQSGVHMTAYIANLLIKGYAVTGNITEARAIFESLADPPSGVAASGNHVPHDSTSAPLTSNSVSYREVSSYGSDRGVCFTDGMNSHRHGSPCFVQNSEMDTVIVRSLSWNG